MRAANPRERERERERGFPFAPRSRSVASLSGVLLANLHARIDRFHMQKPVLGRVIPGGGKGGRDAAPKYVKDALDAWGTRRVSNTLRVPLLSFCFTLLFFSVCSVFCGELFLKNCLGMLNALL